MTGSRTEGVRRLPHERLLLLLLVVGLLAWSAIHPADRFTWWLEVSWVLAGVPLAVATHRAFPLTPTLERLLAFFACILIVRGAYTYECVPVGDWCREWTGGRNCYDRFGHFFQGVIPAVLARELLRRTSPMQPGRWLGVVCIWGAVWFSATFELIEMTAALVWGNGADAFLGTQGDVWDAQKDILAAFLGSSAAILLLSGRHERQLRAMRLVPSGMPAPA